ncbi:biotin--[acetyl-CoA-carboxylase] ligase [Brevirhabdus pacifica]|uniref:biotin--[biotin carboxyl-carrier protein] ligase n=2 Tax=Brevirhabdus pacifica TaxID=1267768 RepID=A0A1U7DL25_9RHOB|nr:biotin--[acetyl-CoA-carboxylase] ligase [Brevirhabdus pacifica]APX90625.1 biotin--[acetyl-CoA-carboxylase] ligase [Brevirhabdus pacifica]OWU78384.1 biotin--acetyl-CoA-carboxylase ligase [Loktanella sp. 22II-4b]PJJ85234.1 BirA family biotin operon repressor/biotin-[acetyl-CoA-carboxylase] ligase [Brevirhabdus pacifica]
MAADSGWPTGVGRRIYDTLDSTNAEAARLAPELAGPTWILAREQTAARGRRGRPWQNPAGNFAATLVSRPDEPPERLALRSFVAALALRDAFVAVTGRPGSFALKWPNDVLLNGGKVAGILLETLTGGGTPWALAVGVGVNLRMAPDRAEVEPGAVAPVSLMSETGACLTPEEFLDQLAPAYAMWESRLTTYGFAPVREAWLQNAARLGETVTARTGRDSWEGRFETIDDSGALILVTARGRQAIPAAEIHF